ncbi:Vms1/Ankzf1 family peptidyl-tRNA hydrolase [Streptomyces sp. LP05-1]|uniref:Vms1/Ankzf1 family peptidyl-tRNA hydrolase n=1 Tax=Streptomyces pyxinae TaxID=2970734 RepID=A0ABT2CMI6_9ACTN|nr:Vms1/Ankzf1 family peptidyl-tRNA hydrolase [Streptomyces sp. LP05-1]MCS0638550.1 Vms1/Ankzf1 family peptidyl-tRNA hydrolase [Streptomyces sp. LP05-1]
MQLAFLTSLFDRPGPWASVYLDTSQVDEAAGERRELQAREVCRALVDQGADRATGQAVYEALTSDPRPPGEQGRAVFAAHGEVVLDPPLAHRPLAPADVTWSALPRLGPLLDLSAQEPVALVAYVDRTGADLELRTPLGGRPAGQVKGRDWPVHRTASADWSERHFQAGVENTWEHNAAEIAGALAESEAETGADLIVLAGDTRERRSVHGRLPVDLQPLVVESEHGGRAAGASTRLLDEDVEAARQEHLRRTAETELDRFRSARSPRDGRPFAAEGIPALVEAAREHRIEELLIRTEGPDAHREVWVGAEPDQLAVRRSEAHYLGEREPVAARADDALLRSAVMAGAEVLRVRPETDDDVPVGGLGALLRWPYEEAESEAARELREG